jgi:hypothetical protein
MDGTGLGACLTLAVLDILIADSYLVGWRCPDLIPFRQWHSTLTWSTWSAIITVLPNCYILIDEVFYTTIHHIIAPDVSTDIVLSFSLFFFVLS